MQTRSQQYSQKVYDQIHPLKDAIDNAQDRKSKKENEKKAKQYGSLCHNFPLMVLRSGLSQAVAFVWVKSKGKEDKPQAQFLKHLAELVEFSPANDPKEFQKYINELELITYQRHTRKILAASIWYKRFAESILDVKAGDDDIDENDDGGSNDD